MVVLRSKVAKLQPALARFLAGYRQAMLQYDKNEPLAISVLRANTHVPAGVAKQTYQFYRQNAPYNVALTPSTTGLQNTIDFVSQSLPTAKGLKASQLVDLRVLKQVPALKGSG